VIDPNTAGRVLAGARRHAHLVRDWNGRFRPGQAGPGPGPGRPKSIAAIMRTERPQLTGELVQFWALIAFGSAAVVKRFGAEPRIQDRLDAAGQPCPTALARASTSGTVKNSPTGRLLGQDDALLAPRSPPQKKP
jgi:hypothetical protein